MSRATNEEPVDVVMAALADPTRRMLYETLLREPGLTSSQLAARAKQITRWGVIKHMAVLRDAGLIQTMATGRLRRHYAERAALDPLRGWLEGVSR